MFRTARLELQPHYIQMKKKHCQVSILFSYEKLNVFLGSVVASTLKRKTETQAGTTVPQHLLHSVEPSREKIIYAVSLPDKTRPISRFGN